ncbi:conidiation protein 6 [Kalaharituber pfeilii]|nr:conidiation protein 6 [Kalaharituber pfeilii]
MSEKNPGNVIGGHKATISNPTRSEAAKQHSQQVLEEEYGGGEGTGGHQGAEARTEKNPGNVIGGYKATLSNPTIGSGAKAKAKERLNEMGVEVEED